MATFTPGAGAYVSDDGLVLPGVAGNYAYSSDTAALSITGDIAFIAKVTLTDWTPSVQKAFIAKWLSTGNQASYAFCISTTGSLVLYNTTDGVTALYGGSTVNLSVSDGDTLWVGVSLDVDDGAGNRVHTFWTSTDGTTWTQLGSTVTTAGATTIYDGTASVEVGSVNSGLAQNPSGTIHRAQIYSGAGFTSGGASGTLVYDANFETAPAGADGFIDSTTAKNAVVIAGISTPYNNSSFTENYFLVPGVGAPNNYLTLPYAADLNTALDDFSVIVRVNSPDWKHRSGTWLQLRYTTNNVVYAFYVVQAGIALGLSTAGVALTSFASVDSAVLTGGTTYWLKVERRASDGRVQFFYAADQSSLPSSWTQLGADQTAVTGTLFSGAATMYPMGASNFGVHPMTVKFYRSMFYNGLHSGGSATLLRDVDAAYGAHTTFAEKSSNAALVTVVRATSGAKTQFVTTPSLQFATSRFLTFPDNSNFDIAASDSFTIAGTFRHWGTPGATQLLVDKLSATPIGWRVAYTTARAIYFLIHDGTTQNVLSSAAQVAGDKLAFVAVRDVANDTLKLYVNGVEVNMIDTTTGTLANSVGVTFGASSSGTSGADMEWLNGPYFYRQALTPAQVGVLTKHMQDNSGV